MSDVHFVDCRLIGRDECLAEGGAVKAPNHVLRVARFGTFDVSKMRCFDELHFTVPADFEADVGETLTLVLSRRSREALDAALSLTLVGETPSSRDLASPGPQARPSPSDCDPPAAEVAAGHPP